ncbi:hypothetical protein ACFQZZ_23215 [Nocardia sp. GCM10030253]|uniref:hypothetical protein n=1 Tax=Nocardia sp. GCM10030253 TaxID=3273404 RepID=UPI00364307A7
MAMGMRGVVERIVVLAAVAVVAVACGGGNESSPPSRERSAVVTNTGTAPGPSSHARAPQGTTVPSVQAPEAPPSGPPPEHSALIIKTLTISGGAVPDVPVTVRLVQPCDPALHDIPVGETAEVRHWTGSTDRDGTTTFSVPVGCYVFTMDPPPGSSPVPEGMHSAFVTAPGQIVSGVLRFEDPAPLPCTAEAIVDDLDVPPYLAAARVTVSECEGGWAVIVWDVPGDSQRIVVRNPDGWTTYVYFPHDVCWTEAVADGVPTRLQRYFLTC